MARLQGRHLYFDYDDLVHPGLEKVLALDGLLRAVLGILEN